MKAAVDVSLSVRAPAAKEIRNAREAKRLKEIPFSFVRVSIFVSPAASKIAVARSFKKVSGRADSPRRRAMVWLTAALLVLSQELDSSSALA